MARAARRQRARVGDGPPFRHAERQGEAGQIEDRDEDIRAPDAESGHQRGPGKRAGDPRGVHGRAGHPDSPHQVIARDGVADQGIAHHLVVRTEDATERRGDEHERRRQHVGEAQDHQDRRQEREARPHAAEHGASAQAVAERPEHRRGQRAELLQRAERGEQEHRPRAHHHVPAEDQRLHLEGPGREEIGGPLEAEAAHAQRGEGQRRVGAPHCATGRDTGSLEASGSERSGGEGVAGP